MFDEKLISPANPWEVFDWRKFFWNDEKFALKFFGNVRQEKIDGRTWCVPSRAIKVFAARNFLKQWRVTKEKFWNCDTEKLRRKNVIPTSLIHGIFSLPDCFWNTEEFSLNFFGIMRLKQIWRNFAKSPVLSICFIRYQKFFSETRKSSQWNFPVLWFKNFSTEKRDIPFCHA